MNIKDVDIIRCQLSEGLIDINKGGCGYFAIFLQKLIGGKIIHRCSLNNGHFLVMWNEYFIDADKIVYASEYIKSCGVKGILSKQKRFDLDKNPHRYPLRREKDMLLFFSSEIMIRNSYDLGEFYGSFLDTNYNLMKLKLNYEHLIQLKMTG